MDALAADLARRRLRLKDYFQDYDRLRSGTVTLEQAKRVFATAGVLKSLSDAEWASVYERFAQGDKFFHAAFVQELDVLEANAVSAGALQRPGQVPDAGTIEHAAFVLCAQQSAAGGVDVRQSFHPFDKHNNGKITASQFRRSFPFKLDPTQLDAIMARYEQGGKADYFAFDSDLRTFVGQQRGSGTQKASDAGSGSADLSSTAGGARRADADSVSSSLSELRYHLAKEQVNILDCFRDYDKLRSGAITAGQFASGLGRVVLRGFKLSQRALDALIAAYAVDDDGKTPSTERRVSYSRFLRDLEHAPVGGPHAAAVAGEDAERIRAILDKIRTAIRTRRVNLKPTFQDFDRANKGIFASRICTRKRFERALAVNGITLSTKEVDLLEAAYAVDRVGEDDTDAINYVAFCADVDVPDGVVESPGVAKAAPVVGQGTFNAVTGITLVKKEATLDRVLDVAMLQIAARSIRLSEFIRDYDPLRSGTVTKDKLATALSMSGLKLEQDQVQVLLDAYSVSPGSNLVAYPRLLADLDCDAEGAADRHVHRVDEARARVTAEAQAATEAMHSEQLDAILQRIRDDVRARQILLPPFFQDYDKHHRGSITAAQFERVLCRHRLPVSPSDMNVLKQYFADPTDPSQVRCRDFIAAVDAAEASRMAKHLRTTTSDASGSLSRSAVSSPSVASPRRCSLSDVLERVSQTVLSRNIRVSELFRDADPLRKGYCHEGKFAGCLNALGISLTEPELAVLREAYDEPRNVNSVNYSRFSRDVEAAEQQRAQGNDLLSVGSGVTVRAAPPQGDISASEAAIEADPFLAKVITHVRQVVRARRMSLRTALQDFDRLRKGRIATTQFYSALSANGLTFNALETSKLNELLAQNGTTNYHLFCRLVGE